ncbi:hypothetical protein SSE37_08448 [Sagittula stellata E-37]|uniref:Uncharacterized protein n=1 Tax=Sagittula stellata (strain ATCC 700073 / DSM 11524 / E-37) TaxID=388399 RepID=A3JZC1_SAGS3|nr:hypothetical protein SSE37_08448 [Sagittula stellata E-37]
MSECPETMRFERSVFMSKPWRPSGFAAAPPHLNAIKTTSAQLWRIASDLA